jgi:hypothetical protein
MDDGRAIAQAVSRQLPTAAARIRARVRSCGICGGQSGTGAGFLRVLRFPLPILIPPAAPHSSSIIRGWYNRPISGRRTSGLSPTPPKETKKKKLIGLDVVVEIKTCSPAGNRKQSNENNGGRNRRRPWSGEVRYLPVKAQARGWRGDRIASVAVGKGGMDFHFEGVCVYMIFHCC